ncbi:hypothetical protein BC831DRAFT_398580 [Entophlyctis helioformis]|nr:hypothetical protein BC831DRAFT_398580 [Entophlyctis helioformis]
MKRCMAEDVEPCLWYSYQQPVSGYTKITYGVGLALSFKKRLMECAMRGQCEVKLVASIPSSRPSVVTQLPPSLRSGNASQDATGHSRGVSQDAAVPKERCTVCTIVRDCEYGIKLVPVASGSKEWTPLCRFCRDRVTSVLDFFTYVGYMRQGLIGPGKQNATILSIFRQMLWLRRRMAVAKIGSCSVFETTVSAITGPGGGGDWETDIKILP